MFGGRPTYVKKLRVVNRCLGKEHYLNGISDSPGFLKNRKNTKNDLKAFCSLKCSVKYVMIPDF